ncbi:hypothetical protein Pint_04465 [Pistacia integerrima]|uniref:Uncharacterized protein n=1 Tax=Pistacia integerrima TaxID=434235 RepID=A0ACC0Z6W0_9ROSI|nr:hypothetical protein Pint_04465 [Pistacia integerrima]
METVQQRLNGELRYHKVINKEVESWLKKAEKIVKETKRTEDKFRKGNYFLRGWRGKHVDEKIQEVKRVSEQGVFPADLVIDAPDDIGLPLPTSEVVGEVSVKEKIWKHLIGDEVCKIGVCGMGGVGKTTIMKHIHNQLLDERNKFDKVIWATVSKEYAVVKLQQDIATAPREDLSKHNDITMRAAVLQEMLKGKKRYVLILDDVWKQISLEEVGIPEPTVMDGCKLVLTTRSTEVARSMGCERLEENCLLESADDGDCVKMHDLVRDMAVHITSQSPRYLVKAGMQLRELPTEHEWTEDLQKVSLMRNNISKFCLDMTLPKFTALSTLLLQYNSSLKEIDDSIFTLMTELKVLDLSHCYSIRNLPNSISGLVKLTALLLNGCGNLEHVPSLAKLGALKKLDLGWTGITAIPDGLEMLVHLRYLDLFAHRIKEMPGGILPKLFRLQYLRLDNAVAEAEEVSRLSKLESLGLGDYFLEGRRGKAVGIGGLTNFGDSIKIPTDIRRLFIAGCNDLRSVSDISSLKDATDWRECWIYQCKQMECFYYLSSHTTALQTLEYLFLENLYNLIAILGEEIDGAKSTLPTPITPGIFSCLKTVQIVSCPKLKRLFPPKLLRNLQNLEEIDVSWCSGLVEIVAASSDEEEEDKEAIECPKLKTISPLFPQPDNGQPFPPASLERLIVDPKEWWNSLEWDHPNTKNVLERFLQ